MPHSISGLLNKLFIASLLSVGGLHAASVLASPGYISGNIYTVAGNGTFGYSGDGGQATSAQLNFPQGIAVDSAGNLYIADSKNNLIRKVTTPTGIITTVAGKAPVQNSSNISVCYSPDDNVPATSSNLCLHKGVAVDSTGNLYIVNYYRTSIRKVTDGIISTVVGQEPFDPRYPNSVHISYPNDVAVDSAGNLYIADNSNRILKVSPQTHITTVAGTAGISDYSGDGGLATSAIFDSPSGVAVDSAGNLYIADTKNHRIRKVTASTGIITTVAGNGTSGNSGDGGLATSAQLSSPQSIAVDSAGNLYIADTSDHRIRKVTASTGIITTVAGNGTPGYSGDTGSATSAQLNSPVGIALDSAGNLYIADTSNNRIRMVAAGQTSTLTSQTIKPVTFSPTTLAVGGTTTVSATTTSSLAVSFSSTTPTICTVSGSTVTGVAAGSCTIAANQAGNSNYSAAAQVTGSIQVTGANQGTVSTQSQTISAISFSSGMTSIPLNYELGIRATASSGLAVTFTSLTPDICSIGSGFGGTLVNSISAGTCTIAADQAGNSSYSAAPQVTGSIQVTGANPGTGSTTTQSQTIGAISFSPTTIAVGGTSTVSATASSSLEVVFTSLTPSICTITASKGSLFSADTYTVTGVAAGACTIAANQAGGSSLLSGSYSAAPQVTQNITIGSSQTDCLLNWAEKAYAQYFSPAGATDVTTVAPYTYRYYSGAGNYLAVSSTDNSVYVLGPVSGNTLEKVGPVTSFLGVSGCQ